MPPTLTLTSTAWGFKSAPEPTVEVPLAQIYDLFDQSHVSELGLENLKDIRV